MQEKILLHKFPILHVSLRESTEASFESSDGGVYKNIISAPDKTKDKVFTATPGYEL